jgi:hypothetical protein
MRTILVLAGGRATDRVVFDTALAAAKPLGANLEFLHVRISPREAAASALGDLEDKAQKRASSALPHFEELCEREAIDIAIWPTDPKQTCVSACEEHDDDAAVKIVRCERHYDFTVIGRR